MNKLYNASNINDNNGIEKVNTYSEKWLMNIMVMEWLIYTAKMICDGVFTVVMCDGILQCCLQWYERQ